MFVITAYLTFHRSHVDPHCIYRELCQYARDLQKSSTIKEDTYVLNSRIMSYILNILIV
jgi:hypothetical protein